MKRLKYIIRSFSWLKALNSPFKPFTIRVYCGKTAIGVPYFFPRKWVKFNKADCLKQAIKETQNKNHIYHGLDPNDIVSKYARYSKPVQLTIGFSFCGLGWKTKWTETDYRFEWNPVLSFVFFGYQIALTIYHKHDSHFWESWLYYTNDTDKTKSKEERVAQCRKEAPQTWTFHPFKEDKETIDYYDRILKQKYLNKKLITFKS